MNWEDFKEETLEELIEFLKLKGDAESESWAQAAFINITFRYRKYLLEKCTRMCLKNGLTETDAEEITNRAFESLYEKCAFHRSKCKVQDMELCFKFYLFQIAKHEFVDYVKPDESPYTGEEKVITSLIDSSVSYRSEKLSQLREAEAKLDTLFSTLTPKHKIIYLTYLFHEHEGKYLPKRLREELRMVLNISQSTIRVYKQQAFELAKSKGYGK